MSKAFSLRTLLDLAERKSNEAATRLGGLNSQVMHTEAKLSLLLNYREEYRSRFRATLSRDLDAGSLRNFQDFMCKLDQAIDQQRGLVEQSRQLAQAGRRDWQTKQQRVTAFDTLAQRQASAQARRISRSEQRAADEHVSRSIAWRGKSR